MKKLFLLLIILPLLACIPPAPPTPTAILPTAIPQTTNGIAPDQTSPTVGFATPSMESTQPQDMQSGSLTYEEVETIAQESACTKEGNLLDTYIYNETTKTWWIDLAIEKEGCSPACVVSEESKTAEINWRCTGLLPE